MRIRTFHLQPSPQLLALRRSRRCWCRCKAPLYCSPCSPWYLDFEKLEKLWSSCKITFLVLPYHFWTSPLNGASILSSVMHVLWQNCDVIVIWYSLPCDDDNLVDQPVQEDDVAVGHVGPQPLALLERRHGEAVPVVLKWCPTFVRLPPEMHLGSVYLGPEGLVTCRWTRCHSTAKAGRRWRRRTCSRSSRQWSGNKIYMKF